MKIVFFEAKPRGKKDSPAAVSIRPKGQVTLNQAAVKLLEAEAGEAATLGYDDETKCWLLAHWPNGKAGQPELRGAGTNAKDSLRFQASGPTTAFYLQLPAVARQRASISCLLKAEAFTDEAFAGATFYALALPDELTSTPAAEAASTARQVGVGRGNYDRSKSKKGAGRG